MQSPLPGVYRPAGCKAHSREVFSEVRPSDKPYTVSREQFLPPLLCADWPLDDMASTVNRFWARYSTRIVTGVAASDQVCFSRPDLVLFEIQTGVVVNVLRWVSRYLAEGVYPCVGQLSTRGVDSMFKRETAGGNPNEKSMQLSPACPTTLYLSLSNADGKPANNGKTIVTTLTCCPFGLHSSFLESRNTNKSVSDYPKSNDDSLWIAATKSLLGAVCDQAPFTPYHVLTDYNDWAFVELLDCDRAGMTARVMWRRMHDTAPSVRECLAALATAPRRLFCYVDLVDCVEFHRAAMRECIRSLRKETTELCISGLDQLSHVEIVGRPWTTGSRRRAGGADYRLLKYLSTNTLHEGIIDLLFDNVSLRQMAVFSNDSGFSGHGSQNRQGNQSAHGYPVGQSTLAPRLVQLQAAQLLLYEKHYARRDHLTHEAKVYADLSHLQGSVLPVVYGIIASDPFSHYDVARQHGLLLEYIPDSILLSQWLSQHVQGDSLAPSIDKVAAVKLAVKIGLEAIHTAQIGRLDVGSHVLVSRRDCAVVFVGLSRCVFNVSEHDWLHDWREFERVFSCCARLKRVCSSPAMIRSTPASHRSRRLGANSIASISNRLAGISSSSLTLEPALSKSLSSSSSSPLCSSSSSSSSSSSPLCPSSLPVSSPYQRHRTVFDYIDPRRWATTFDRTVPTKKVSNNLKVH